MPKYRAWLPKTIMVEAVLDIDENLKPGKKGDHKKLLQAFRDEGECLCHLCPDCEEHMMFEPDDLDYEVFNETDIEFTKID